MTRDELLFSICPGYRITSCCHDDNNYNCHDCNLVLNKWLDEYDKQIRAKAINDYDNKLNEKINTDTRLKDTIRKILDNVAREMYCKGIDDLTEKLKEMANNSSTKYIRLSKKETITTYGVEQIAEELKAGGDE